MKKKVKNTGEIIDVISYFSGIEKSGSDKVYYIDSNGIEMSSSMNYFHDLENIE